MGYGRTWPTKKPWVALRWIAISNPYLIDFIWLKMCFLWRWNCGAYVPRFDWFKQRTLWWPIKTKSWLRSTFKGLSSWDPNVTPILMRKIPNDAKSNEQNMKRTWSYSTIKKSWVNMRTWSYSTTKHKSFGNWGNCPPLFLNEMKRCLNMVFHSLFHSLPSGRLRPQLKMGFTIEQKCSWHALVMVGGSISGDTTNQNRWLSMVNGNFSFNGSTWHPQIIQWL